MTSDDKPPRPRTADVEYVFGSILDELEGRRPTPQRWLDLIEEVRHASMLRAVLGTVELVRIGRFEAIKELGRGGFGVVFEVRDPDLDRHVALKLCRPDSKMAAHELMEEARLLAGLDHPNLVRVYEPGRFGEDVFFVMELVDGQDGHEFATRKPSPSWEQVVDVYRYAGRGLAAAHAEDIVHGDFKPSNILLDENDSPRVSDFGLATRLREHPPEQEPGSPPKRLGGTLAYMAPELLRQEKADMLSDQWAFCVSLWETLEGRLPFFGRTDEDMLVLTVATDPETGRRDIPEHVRDVVRVGLSPISSERYAGMKELVAELDKLREPPSTDPEPELVPGSPATPAIPAPGTLATLGIAFLLFGATVFAAISFSQIPWPWPRDTGDVNKPPEMANSPNSFSAYEEAGDDHPCMAEGAPFEPDPGIGAVCRTLKHNHDDATLLWEELRNSRKAALQTASDWLKFASDTAVLARTYWYWADAIKSIASTDDQLKRAEEISLTAEYLVQEALAALRKVKEQEEPADDFSSAVSQVQGIISEVTGVEE